MAKTATRKSTAKKTPAKKSATGGRTAAKSKSTSAATAKRKPRKVSSKRELIDTGTDKRYVRRRKDGTFKESDDVGRSISMDMRRKSTKKAGKGQGDRGD
jgi:hypothetical protein